MERFFIFDKYNTWFNWDLILTAKDVTPPEPKTNYVKIDGMSGTLDLTEALSGEVTYEDRIVSASFWTDKGTRKDRERLLREIVRVLHGRKITIIEPDDPEHYFIGRVNVKSMKNTLVYAEFTIEATCDPWRYAINDTERTIEVDDQEITAIINNYGVKTLCPTITISGDVSISNGDTTIDLVTGTYKNSSIKFIQGVNRLEISGSGTVTFTYKEADL